jgi:CheY-like chemotaxis protein
MADRRLTESVVVSCKVISFEGLKPDLILLDFAMPRMNESKRLRYGRSPLIVLLSSHYAAPLRKIAVHC